MQTDQHVLLDTVIDQVYEKSEKGAKGFSVRIPYGMTDTNKIAIARSLLELYPHVACIVGNTIQQITYETAVAANIYYIKV